MERRNSNQKKQTESCVFKGLLLRYHPAEALASLTRTYLIYICKSGEAYP